MAKDLRETIFEALEGRTFTAEIRVRISGLVCGLDAACRKAEALGCEVVSRIREGGVAQANAVVLTLKGSAQALAMAEDVVPGSIGKTSGVARAARKAVELAGGRVRIISGAVKKLPVEFKPQVRQALVCAGAGVRIADGPFIYLDKNYVRMFGSVRATLRAVSTMQGFRKAIQLRGQLQDLATETRDALDMGADILMVDTGTPGDLDTVSGIVRELGMRERVTIAYAGDIGLEDIPGLAARDVDILGVGRAILDAPMVDLKMDVKHQAPAWVRQRETHADYASRGERTPEMELNLLEKTELRIDGITLEGTNLTDLAEAVAVTLGLPRDKVLVIDVRLGQVALDLLVRTVSAEQVFGRKRALLDALAKIPGVTLRPDAAIHSAGILGAIGLDEEDAPRVIEASRAMTTNILANKRGRIRVFPTGFELVGGIIEDTNTPFLVKVLGEAGYMAEAAEAVPDSLECLGAALGEASDVCGLALTTGGVGAEDKDFSVEAILSLDPEAATPYLVRFTKGEGRHVKDGVRIGVGEYNGCLLVALPGPNDEVRMAAPVLVRGLKERCGKEELARRLAEVLRDKLRDKQEQWHAHGHGHWHHDEHHHAGHDHDGHSHQGGVR